MDVMESLVCPHCGETVYFGETVHTTIGDLAREYYLIRFPEVELPGIIDEMARVTSRISAVEFLIEYSGQRFSIPKKTPSRRMINTIGEEDTQKLMEYFGFMTGEYVPKADLFLKKERNVKIRLDFDKNSFKLIQLAKKYNLCTRTIAQILNSND